ncbi:MAG: hypothetical protein P4M02_12420 [Clostridia bacterium]|nr:hypothetical protein [Clostridia bacterium]
MQNQRTFIVALGGIMAALSIVLMFLSGIVPAAEIALPALAGILLVAVSIEAGSRWAFLIYGAVCVLSVLLAPDKQAAIFYIVFFGHYPLVKKYIEGIHRKWLQWAAKIGVFDLCMLVAAVLCVSLTGLQLQLSQRLYVIAMIVLLNVTFVVYDFAISRLIVLYVYRLRKVLKIK